MAMTDPIADMLVRIRNAYMAEHDKLNMPSSKIKGEIAAILREEGYIRNFKIIKDRKQGILRIYLKYTGVVLDSNKKQSVIQGIKRISTPGCRVYVGKEEIPNVLGGLGTVILSTNQGLLTDAECNEKKLGGEVLCSVW